MRRLRAPALVGLGNRSELYHNIAGCKYRIENLDAGTWSGVEDRPQRQAPALAHERSNYITTFAGRPRN